MLYSSYNKISLVGGAIETILLHGQIARKQFKEKHRSRITDHFLSSHRFPFFGGLKKNIFCPGRY
jgi:hypothetical protein